MRIRAAAAQAEDFHPVSLGNRIGQVTVLVSHQKLQHELRPLIRRHLVQQIEDGVFLPVNVFLRQHAIGVAHLKRCSGQIQHRQPIAMLKPVAAQINSFALHLHGLMDQRRLMGQLRRTRYPAVHQSQHDQRRQQQQRHQNSSGPRQSAQPAVRFAHGTSHRTASAAIPSFRLSSTKCR